MEPFSTETGSLNTGVQAERQKEVSEHRRILSPTRSVLTVVVEGAGIHLSVSGRGHELELRGIHEDRAVGNTVHVIKQGSGGAL